MLKIMRLVNLCSTSTDNSSRSFDERVFAAGDMQGFPRIG